MPQTWPQNKTKQQGKNKTKYRTLGNVFVYGWGGKRTSRRGWARARTGGTQQTQGQQSRSFHKYHHLFSPFPFRDSQGSRVALLLKIRRPQTILMIPKGVNEELYLSKVRVFCCCFFFKQMESDLIFRRQLSDLRKVSKLSNNPPLHPHSKIPGLRHLPLDSCNSPHTASPPPPLFIPLSSGSPEASS